MFGLPPVTSFPDITPDAELAASLEHLYNGNISNVDAYVGGLAEPHYGNAHVGQLFFSSIFDQFHRLRDGDWWYYKNTANGLFNAQETAEIDSTNLRDIILRNTNITEVGQASTWPQTCRGVNSPMTLSLAPKRCSLFWVETVM